MRTIVIAVLFIYSFFQFLKFMVGATVSDAKSHITDNWDSDERYEECKRDLKTFGKSVLAFILAGIVLVYF